MKLLDTSVAVDYLRGHVPARQLLDGLVSDDEPVVSSELVRFELLTGVRDAARGALEDFFRSWAWVAVDERIARWGSQLAQRYRAAHSGIDDIDYLVAATALTLDATLLTTNVRHFPMLTGLQPPY